MNLALSTSWNAFRHKKGEALLFEIAGLGFREIELSFNLTPKVLKEIQRALKNVNLKVNSLHNYCPIPRGLKQENALPDCYAISSTNEKERRLALNYTKASIDTAAAFKAKAVVLHCGRVEIPDRTRLLIGLFEKGFKDTRDFRALKKEIIGERKRQAGPFLENTLASLQELNQYAKINNICLGIETRFYYREIPTLAEIGIILDTFKDSQIYYWHDTGHARVMENLGFCLQRDYLDLYAKRMLGAHLHDVCACRDHQAPGQGELDFSGLAKYLRPEMLKVIEAHHPATGDDVRKSKVFLEKVLN